VTRRDRAALVLAYEQLRNSASGGNRAWRDGAVTRVVADAKLALRETPIDLAFRSAYADASRDYLALRLLRARLALLIRALLRADAGDYGPRDAWRCVACLSTRQTLNADSVPWFFVCDDCGARGGEWLAPPRWLPLWASAPTRAR
jgi:hypothetical protein